MLAKLTAAALLAAVATAHTPSGSYCGSYLVVRGKVTINSADSLAFTYDVMGDSKTCKHEAYHYDASKGVVALPGFAKKGDCVGDLVRDNGLDGLSIKYDAAANKVMLDASVAQVELTPCN